MAKATHYGICQACGAEQKLPNGTLSNHGYTVAMGWFEGTCAGSKRLPFELSCDYIKTCIERAKKAKEDYKQQIQKFQDNNTTTTEYHQYIRRGDSRLWVKAQVIDGKIVMEWYDDVPCRRLSLYGTDLEIAKKLDEKKIKWLERQIKAIDDYIQWQEGRIVNWEEKELTPIKES